MQISGKYNPAFKEGDTVLIMDKDTYAVGNKEINY